MKIYGYIRLSNNQYPLFEGDIRLEHLEITENQTGNLFPCPEDFAPVMYAEPPIIDFEQKQYFIEIPPIQIDDIWTMQYQVNTYTDKEYAIQKELRSKAKYSMIPELNKSGSQPNVIE
jgi:hypothetical protein